MQNSKRDCFAALAMTDKTVMKKKVAGCDKSILCKVHYKKIRASVDLPALSEMFSRLKSASILGGNAAKADADRFSYWAAEPKEIFESKTGQKDPFGKLQKVLDKYKLHPDTRLKTQDSRPELPKGIFCGGWIGYFSYELGRYIERLPETTIDDLQMPLIRLCFYDRLIAYDHIEGVFWLIVLEFQGDSEKPQDKLASLEKLLAESQKIHISQTGPADLDNIDFSQIRCNMNKDYYMRTVEKIKRYIYDGEVYQINFSQRFECDYDARPIRLYHWQNHYNPSGYAAYIDGGNFHIVSASPEMFITIDDGLIRTKPIKGTRRRISETARKNPHAKQINAKNFNELLHCEKERAELDMIIDLERNDVAKICKPGTREVIQPRTSIIEAPSFKVLGQRQRAHKRNDGERNREVNQVGKSVLEGHERGDTREDDRHDINSDCPVGDARALQRPVQAEESAEGESHDEYRHQSNILARKYSNGPIIALEAVAMSLDPTSIQCMYSTSSLISTVIVPGVSVIELARKTRAISDFRLVRILTTPGLICRPGDSTRSATSMLDLRHM